VASINDVNNSVNKVNTTLWKVISAIDTLNTSAQNEITATNNVTTSVNTLDGDVKSGFSATEALLKAIAEIELGAVDLLYHLTQQADTMICALENISKNTCGILTQATIQTGLQKRLVEDAGAIRAIEESAHPEATLELHRLAALRAQIEKCCPPPKPEPACTYAPCPAPPPLDKPSSPTANALFAGVAKTQG
jgi:uncharacterized protein YoxC